MHYIMMYNIPVIHKITESDDVGAVGLDVEILKSHNALLCSHGLSFKSQELNINAPIPHYSHLSQPLPNNLE